VKEICEVWAVVKGVYRLVFRAQPPPLNLSAPRTNSATALVGEKEPEIVSPATGSYFDALPEGDEVPVEILEFFQPEAEEHLQIVSDCLLSLEGNNNPEEINKLFRAIHTVKGSAAQVGLKRLGAIAHRVEDLIGRIRDGELEPSPQVIDLCLESTDVLKKTLQKQWADEAEMRTGVDSLLAQIAEFAPLEVEESEQTQTAQSDTSAEAASETPSARVQNTDKQQQAAAAA